MSASEKYQYLSFNVKILMFLNIWPSNNEPTLKWKQYNSYIIFAASVPTFVPCIFESFFGFYENDIAFAVQVQGILAIVCIFGMFYLAFCFLRNVDKIKDIVDDLDNFKAYSNLDIIKIDQEATFRSKALLMYSLIGMLFYTCTPLFSMDHCEQHKFESMKEYGVPCGLITRFRLPFSYEESPLFEIFVLHTIFVAGTTTIIIVTITMLICGLLYHIINQLKQVRILMLEVSNLSGDEIIDAMKFAVNYHITIIEYLDRVNDAFGTQLILYITLTSFVISVLGFEILMIGDFGESVRFAMHLAGWFLLLYLICLFGQWLIDESFGIAQDVYFTPWYNSPLVVQKDVRLILLRAQKPLTLNAINLGTFSAATFLRVLSSSYSYFTLLLNVK